MIREKIISGYRVIYRLQDQEVTIVTVIHGRQAIILKVKLTQLNIHNSLLPKPIPEATDRDQVLRVAGFKL